jgi:FKBP-type peptidyl-prolyl cis-trans isomerase 2
MLRDTPTTTYSDTEQFVLGQHIIPPVIEQQVAEMQPGEAKTFPLSSEEGFGPYDETRTTTIQTADLPLDAVEGDIVYDYEDRPAMIVKIFPETTVLDLNHPLAGKPLIITLQIVTIENPDEVDKNTETGNGHHPGCPKCDASRVPRTRAGNEPPTESRHLIKSAIEERYTLPGGGSDRVPNVVPSGRKRKRGR